MNFNIFEKFDYKVTAAYNTIDNIYIEPKDIQFV